MIITKSAVGIHILSNSGEYQTTVADYDAVPGVVNNEPLITDDAGLAAAVGAKFDTAHAVLVDWRFNRYTHLLNAGLVTDYSSYVDAIRKLAFTRSKDGIRQAAGGKDVLVAETINAIEDLIKIQNSLHSRLVELYDIHFPELSALVHNPISYAKIIAHIGNKTNYSSEELTKKPIQIPPELADNILAHVHDSVGVDLEVNDMKVVTDFAQSFLELEHQKYQMEVWIEKTMEEIAPNVAAVAGTIVGAKLISKVGGLRALALLPGSKIQTLGAEKALYKAMKFRGKTPKHGIIFQIPEIGVISFWLRGKMARAYANKIAIAARLDYFKGEFLGSQYREALVQLANELRVKYPNPPARPTRPERPPRNKYRGSKSGNVSGNKKNRKSKKWSNKRN